MRESFHRFGEVVTERLELAAVLALGLMFAPGTSRTVPGAFGPWEFAVLVLVVVRPIAIELAMLGGRIDRRQRLAVRQGDRAQAVAAHRHRGHRPAPGVPAALPRAEPARGEGGGDAVVEFFAR